MSCDAETSWKTGTRIAQEVKWLLKEIMCHQKGRLGYNMEHACVIALSEKAECRTECRDFPGGPVVKNLPCKAWDTGSISG